MQLISRFEVLFAFAMAALYVALYRLSDVLAGNEAIGGIASLIFLPAFVRLLGFLVIGWWITPALFVAGLFCVDLGLGLESRAVVAAAIAVGAPIGISLVSRFVALDTRLFGLTATKLLVLSFASALGNALFYKTSVMLVRGDPLDPAVMLFILAGDTLGAWAVIVTIKWLLTLVARVRF